MNIEKFEKMSKAEKEEFFRNLDKENSVNRMDRLTVALRYWLLGKRYFKAVNAMEFASKYHVGTRKDNVTPEFEHQISIALYVRTLSQYLLKPQETFTTIFLHDIPEDYDVSIDAIRRMFGITVANAVSLVTKKFDGEKKNLGFYYKEMSKCPIASFVKGADRIHNIQTSHAVFSKEGQKWYIQETEEYILPMLKTARRSFPQQEFAYENVKHLLNSQIDLIKAIHKARGM